MTRTLLQDVRSEQNMFAAWRHVKRSALMSGNPEIRGMASEFEHAHQKHLKRFIDQLRQGRFTFDPVEGVLKDKRKREAAGKQPRPIVIATLKSRIVQRAILQVLQRREARDLRSLDIRYETKSDPRLGIINAVNRSAYGVGGLIYPYGGVQPAIKLITGAIDAGAKYFYQSDIKAFFTHIPKAQVVNFVRNKTGDAGLTDLFAQGLAVHLANPDELKGYQHLFPRGGVGVAQGSSLSAFAGNVLLFDLDRELNSMGVTSVRYIDDILMVAANMADLEAAIRYAEERLKAYHFGLYTPSDDPNKAAQGETSRGINFLGCTIQPNRCVPSSASVKKIKESVSEALSASKAAVVRAIQRGDELDPKKSRSATLEALGKRLFGWQRSFSFCNDGQPFRHLDDYVAKQVADYEAFVGRKLKGAVSSVHMTVLGIPSTERMFRDLPGWGKRKFTKRKNASSLT